MKAFWKLLITRVLNWLSGIKADDFNVAVANVRNAQEIFELDADATEEERVLNQAAKRKYVLAALKKLASVLGAAALNLLLETAVNYVKKETAK